MFFKLMWGFYQAEALKKTQYTVNIVTDKIYTRLHVRLLIASANAVCTQRPDKMYTRVFVYIMHSHEKKKQNDQNWLSVKQVRDKILRRSHDACTFCIFIRKKRK